MNLSIFNTTNLFEAATNLFQQLGIKLNSNTTEPLPVRDLLKLNYKDNDTFNSISKTYFIGIIDNTVFQATGMVDVNYSYSKALQQADKNYDGLMLFALELSKQPTRTEISDLTRTFNRISQKMPVALVLKYTIEMEAVISIAISERFKYKQNWRQGEKAGKVIILRDIHTLKTHAGHKCILSDLAKTASFTNYDQLHQYWLHVLDVNILNKKFYQDLANWYFWAMNNVSFPEDLEKNKDIRNATNLIRLITRVIFIWFIKEKSLVPNNLFEESYLDKILKDFYKNEKSQNYYQAILQNLFFGTLNQKMNERDFITEKNFQGKNSQFNVTTLYRYHELFSISKEEVKDLFKEIPFLNGGLFDCLDKPNEKDNTKVDRVDGFTSNTSNRAIIPDYIFFSEERSVELNDIYATKNKKYKSKGLIKLLKSYKFTVAENTPTEEEIALDPELLGKVFENLLASYNPETQTTARKQTGSFYTPREIVNYMVDESLLEYIKQNVKNESKDFETRLKDLFSHSENPNPFNKTETKALIEAINNCKILDPACGSGAYPMGILHKMVHILQKIDPENKYWRELQINKAIEETEEAFKIGDKDERAKRLLEINDVFENNGSDYGRKLYLIENCIYGIDIQPIAVQISKLRFFISLIIDQNKQTDKENFGIRSLPNLETKFVAANTLIGLDKPAQTLLRNPEIEVKENQLKELRHKYFTANTRKEKLQYQKQDKKLRQEIAKMLESDGWQTDVAKQIVAFDPYDQNTSAHWFDAEWMFGLTTGFDIVIGNPPYVNVEEVDEVIKNNIKKFRTAHQKYDLYVLFFERGIDLLKSNGQLNFITSNKFLSQGYGLLLRKEFLKYFIHQIINFNYDIFEAATVRTCIFHLQKSLKSFNDKIKIIDVESIKDSDKFHKLKYNYLSQNIFNETDENNFRINLTNEKLYLLNKINKNCLRVDDVFSVNYGLRPNSEKLNLKKDAFIHSSNPTKKYKNYFEGKDMGYWVIKNYSYLDYQPDLMYNPMFPELFETEKLVGLRTLSNITKLRFIYDKDKYYCNDSVVVLTLWHLFKTQRNQTIARNITNDKIDNSNNFSYLFVQAILNSKMIKFYVNELLYDGTHFYPNHMKQLPLKKTDLKVQLPFVRLVKYIFLSIENEIDSSFFERLIDAMVYELYLPEEIKAGNAEVLKHLNHLPELKEGQDENNLKTIEKVYKELSDPKHPISAAHLNLLTIKEINIIEGRK